MSVWYEIMVKGSEDALRGFVAACEAEISSSEAALYGHDIGLEASRFLQRLQGLFAAGAHHLLFAPLTLAQEFIAALRARGEEAGLTLESIHEVVRATMPFSAEAFSPDIAERIRKELLLDLPPGVEAANLEESEERDPSARAAELYTPEHAYVYRVAAAFSGPLPGVVEMQRRARELPFVKEKPLELQKKRVATPGAA
jgi:hypothetical protein